MFSFHLISPFFYFLFVELITKIEPCPKSLHMVVTRKYHNIFLSILSFLMMLGIFLPTLSSNKFKSIHDLICKPYEYSTDLKMWVNIFLYSKYIEWGDTLFLHLSKKPISNLQYYHHMSTAFLVYLHIKNEFVSPTMFIGMFLNSFVHVLMYWYFAYPKGIMKNIRNQITQLQILQHILCFFSIVYAILNKPNCIQNSYSNEIGAFLYTFYLCSFIHFYIQKNYKKID